MRRFVAGRWLAVSCLVLLASCGGGGGSGSGGGGGSPLAFSPSTLGGNVPQGDTGTLTERVTIADPGAITGNVWVVIADPDQVLEGSPSISQIDAADFSATFYTSHLLSIGHHSGSLQVHLCKDQACSQEWVGVSTLPYDIDVEEAPLQATPTTATDSTVPWQGTDNDVVRIAVTGGQQWNAASGASWLVVGAPSSGASPGTAVLTFATQQLAVGDYTTNVTIASGGQSVSVPVSLHVVPPQFTIDSGGSPSFAAVNGAPIAPQPFAFELDNGIDVPWSLSSDAAWLQPSATSGTTPANLTLSVDPAAGTLAAGNYTATLDLSSPGVADKLVSAQLQLVRPTLATAVPTVTLGGDRGRDLSGQSLLLTLNTGTNAYPVSMSALPSWLSITPSQPAVAQSGVTLAVGANVANVTPGSSSQAVVFSSTINGDTVSTPLTVNINADQHRLLPSSWAVAFASSPTGTVTTRTLQVTDNFGAEVDWTAVSDSAWLTATSVGNTGGTSSLVLTANPALVSSETVSVASVRIASTVTGVAPAVVRVGLWKSATGLASMVKLNGTSVSHLVADKTRPYVYANGAGSTITVYNAYTAAPVTVIANVGVSLGPMAISPDGSLLYAIDTASKTIQVVDLATMTPKTSWTMTSDPGNVVSMLAVRPNGVEVLLLGDGTAYINGRALPAPGIVASGNMSATDDGRKVYTIDSGISPASHALWALDYSEVSGGVLYASVTNGPFDAGGQSNGRDVAVAPDGSAVYFASGAPYVCVALSPVDLSFLKDLPGGDPYPNNVEVTQDDRAICGIEGDYASSDFWVYTPAGAIESSFKVAGYAESLKNGQLVVTPDGFVVVAPTWDPLLAFVPIGP